MVKYQEFNLMGSSEQDWNLLNQEYYNADWDNILDNVYINDPYTIDVAANKIVNTIEECVSKVMKHNTRDKPKYNANGIKFKSNNMIPKEVRSLLKRKYRLSKKFRSVRTINRCSSIRNKLLNVDILLKNHYSNKQIKEELDIFEKAKNNKNVLYQYIKRKQNTGR